MSETPEATKRLISSGSSFESEIGYSRAVVVGDQIFVSGTTGFDYATMSIAPDIESQTNQCLKNIQSALKHAGSSMLDIVRVHYILTDPAEFPKTWPILKQYLGESRPVATMLEAGLADPRMKIEIEVTAIRGCGIRTETSNIK